MKEKQINITHGGKRKNAGRKVTGQKPYFSVAFRLQEWQKLAIKTKAKQNGQTVSQFVLARCLPND